MDQNVFKLINICTWTKVVCGIMEVAYEETSKWKMSHLQILTFKLESLKMTVDETIAKYNVRALDIANESFSLN